MNGVASSTQKLQDKVRALLREVARLNNARDPSQQRPKSISAGPPSEVADFFRRRARGLTSADLSGRPPTWAPVATSSMAPIPIGGLPGEVVETTDDPTYPSNQYRWYALDRVEEGGYVFRFDGGRNLRVFVRVSPVLWIGRVIKQVPDDLTPAEVEAIVNRELSTR